MSFTPKLASLPQAQQNVWPELQQVPRHFVLYGGTALALRLGHRQSVDFDFFSSVGFEPANLLRSLPLLEGAEIVQDAPNTLHIRTGGRAGIRIQFLGGLSMGRVVDPDFTDDGVLRVASLYDVAGTKMAAIWNGVAAKDYVDIYALLVNGVPLAEALAAAQAIYGEQFNPMISLRALSDFSGGDLPDLPAEIKRVLSQAAGRTCLETLPVMSRLPGGLCSVE
jgi:hypothetical protein